MNRSRKSSLKTPRTVLESALKHLDGGSVSVEDNKRRTRQSSRSRSVLAPSPLLNTTQKDRSLRSAVEHFLDTGSENVSFRTPNISQLLVNNVAGNSSRGKSSRDHTNSTLDSRSLDADSSKNFSISSSLNVTDGPHFKRGRIRHVRHDSSIIVAGEQNNLKDTSKDSSQNSSLNLTRVSRFVRGRKRTAPHSDKDQGSADPELTSDSSLNVTGASQFVRGRKRTVGLSPTVESPSLPLPPTQSAASSLPPAEESFESPPRRSRHSKEAADNNQRSQHSLQISQSPGRWSRVSLLDKSEATAIRNSSQSDVTGAEPKIPKRRSRSVEESSGDGAAVNAVVSRRSGRLSADDEVAPNAESRSQQSEQATAQSAAAEGTSQQLKAKRAKARKVRNEEHVFSLSSVRDLCSRSFSFPLNKQMLLIMQQCLDRLCERVFQDLSVFAQHAGRSSICLDDVLLLMKRQRLYATTEELHCLIRDELPMEFRKLLIPCTKLQ